MGKRDKERYTGYVLLGGGVLVLLFAAAMLLGLWQERRQDTLEKRLSALPEKSEELRGKKVLFLSSYAPDFITFPEQLSGIDEVLLAHDIGYDVVCMDTKKYGTEQDILTFYEYLKSRLGSVRPYDLIIAGDDAALIFIMERQTELFPETPVIFFAVNDAELAERAAKDPYIAGYVEPRALKETISLALRMQPEAEVVSAIYDDTDTGRGDREAFLECRESFPGLRFEGINFGQLTEEELAGRLSMLDKHTVLLYLSAFRNGEGKDYSISEATELLVGSSGTPIYRSSIGGYGLGIVGGKMLDFKTLGTEAAEEAVRILSGEKSIQGAMIAQGSGAEYVFDYDVLTRYKLNMRAIPSTARILNHPRRFLNENRDVLLPMLLLLLGVGCFWANSAMNSRISRRTARELGVANLELLGVKQDLEYQVNYDSLTGLLKRCAALNLLKEEFSPESLYTVILTDVDNMKMLNESYGHEIGDEYLRETGRLLREYSRERNILASRYGGDEFLVVFLGRHLREDAPEIREMAALFCHDIMVGAERIRIYASGGASLSSKGSTPLEVVTEADLALESSKKGGKNRIDFYSEELREQAEQNSALRERIRKAVAEYGFYMVYQPQVDSRTLEIRGYEALIRMKDYSGSPAVFIPIAEQLGYISKIGRITTELAIRQLAEWRDAGMELHPVSVNFSSYQLNDAGFADYLLNTLQHYEISTEYYVLEITESLFFEESHKTKSFFSELTAAGIRIHLDDFGTGYSSFRYLSYMPLQAVKIDKRLIDEYLAEKGEVLKNMIDIVHNMGMAVVVEGVEEKWQFERLREYGCDEIQGYYFSRPLPAAEVRDWRPKIH